MKIKAEELRIKNWVSFENEPYCIWSEINKYSVDLDNLKTKHIKCASFDEIKPIPLTEEILLKCGFVLYPWGWVNRGLRITTFYFFEREGNSPLKIGYLHQLQNLYFALTNEELQIEL